MPPRLRRATHHYPMHIRSGGCLHPNATAQSASSGPTARRRTTDARKALGYPDSKQRQVTRRPVLADRGEQAIGHRAPALLTSEVFVPVDIVRGAADEDDVEPTVSVDVRHLAAGSGHAHRVEDFVSPLLSLVVLGEKDVGA